MCIILDACVWHSVFGTDSSDHDEFKPVLIWLIKGKGKIVYGGKTFKNELSKNHHIRRIFLELDRKGKTALADDRQVNTYEKIVKAKVDRRKFNDPHIVAIVAVTGCKLICSKDSKAYEFFTNPDLYPEGISKPKIYSRKKNEELLNEKNIAPFCEPTSRGSKDLRKAFSL